ncbi:probable rRNA-processing protein EBP2 homolog [Ipomoea triloba]|uniref:probable rRNA-processing protein EBP2 homolog n=1 Tax=Ipomoea triloba TaxID=35885 RepID=UPI00125E7108|nr:probable rRNA-processing protein EBP2 homolog [Ipomoea triloba]
MAKAAENQDVGMGDPEEQSSESEFETESEEEEEDQEQVVKLAEPSRNAVYNKDGLLDKLGDISWPDKAGWIHKLSIDIDQEGEVDVNDDLARELSFYTQALQGTREAYLKFQSDGVPFLRPSDYYAEMVKSDVHMEKVKGRLLAEKKKIEEAEERKKARENKKLAKEVQAQKQKERAQQKKQEIESVKKWRKQRQQNGFDKNSNAELDLDLEDGKVFQRPNKKRPGVSPGDRSGGKGRPHGGNNKKGSDKKPKGRENRNSKFGFGGKKGLKKQNTADSTNDFRGFSKSDFSSKKRRVK